MVDPEDKQRYRASQSTSAAVVVAETIMQDLPEPEVLVEVELAPPIKPPFNHHSMGRKTPAAAVAVVADLMAPRVLEETVAPE